MISGSYYYDSYEMYISTGTMVYNPFGVERIQKDVSDERLLICEHCGTEYLVKLDRNFLLALRCSQCGGKLKFKR